jgi:hypothetical protein
MQSKFPADYIQGILDTFLFRTFFPYVFCVIVYEIKIYKAIILPAVLYGCVTRLLTLREERRIMASESRVLRNIFELDRKEVKSN